MKTYFRSNSANLAIWKTRFTIAAMIFFASGIALKAQNLALQDLATICRMKNWEMVDQKMVQKGWEYYSSEKGDLETYNTITWSYQKDNWSDKAEGWFYLFTYEGLPSKVVFNFFNQAHFKKISSSISASGYKRVDGEILDERVQTTYQNSSFRLVVTQSKRDTEIGFDNSLTSYTIALIPRESIYDPDNGKKTEYLEDGKVEYSLKNGQIDGLVQRYYSTGEIRREENYRNGKLNGIAKSYFKSGSLRLKETYVNGVENGPIAIYYENGKVEIQQEYRDGKKHGQTKYFDEDGKLQVLLEYRDGIKEGLIRTFYESGDVLLEGQHRKDTFDGRWNFYTKGGTDSTHLYKYKSFNLGILHGPVKLAYEDSIVTCNYRNGVLHGNYEKENKITMPDGLRLRISAAKGTYYNGKRNGFWELGLKSAKGSSGNYENGKKSGPWKYFGMLTDGSEESEPPLRAIIEFKDGLRHGKWIQYISYDSMSIPRLDYIEMEFQYDKVNGKFLRKDSAGSIVEQGFFLDDERSGEWSRWTVIDDVLVFEYCTYRKGDLSGPYTLKLKNGKLFRKGNYLEGERSGQWEYYTEDGKLYAICNFRNDIIDGKWTKFDPDSGKKKSKGNFRNGKLVQYEIFGNDGEGIKESITIDTEDIYRTEFRRKVHYEDSTVLYSYRMNSGLADVSSTNATYEKLASETRQFADSYRFGKYESRDASGNLMIQGVWCGKLRCQTWWKYYSNPTAVAKIVYENGTLKSERFFLNDQVTDFTGTVYEYYAGGKPELEIKVKEGLRNGKTKTFDRGGRVTKVISFKTGVKKR